MYSKKTKIVCTIGPASDSKEMLVKLMHAGMNVMRLNFSHGSYEEHLKKVELNQEINEEYAANIGLLLDTKGPEIRTGDFKGGMTSFIKGQHSVITQEDVVGTSDRFTTTYKDLYKEVIKGSIILINDGQIELIVEKIENGDIFCFCNNDGEVKNKRGINVPGIHLGLQYISEKDKSDIEFACDHPFQFIAASFARRKQDIVDIKAILKAKKREDIQIIAKIENQEGVDNLEDILSVADGIMVARGDLGVEVPAEDVPLIQKEIIMKCKNSGKVVITATQMLESMQTNPRPTRAEVSDVANAIYDGTDAIMLSGESASGKYPEEAVATMAKIAFKTEDNLNYASLHRQAVRTAREDTSEAICMSVAEIASKFNIMAIVAFTESGSTAAKMSRYRPKAPILAATPSLEVTKQLAVNWGVLPYHCQAMSSRAEMLEFANEVAKANRVQPGDQILVTGGRPGKKGDTSYLELVTVK